MRNERRTPGSVRGIRKPAALRLAGVGCLLSLLAKRREAKATSRPTDSYWISLQAFTASCPADSSTSSSPVRAAQTPILTSWWT